MLKSKGNPKTNSGQPSKKPDNLARGGPTIRSTKDNIRKLEVNLVNEGRALKDTFPEVIISEKDLGKVRWLHDDPIVIECKIANQRVGWILIDTGNLSDLISYRCLANLKYKPSSMHKVSHSLVGFGGRGSASGEED